MIYLSSTTKIPEEYLDYYGFMFSANKPIGGLEDKLKCGYPWMMDNNGFTNEFYPSKWLKALLDYKKYFPSCLGIPIPDKVGDALETIRLFSQYWRIVSDLQLPVAFVTQNGITPEITPWDYIDTLFIGGDDGHKLSAEAVVMIAEAKKRGKRVHVGRVNSESRLRDFWMVDSVDGTHLSRMGKEQRQNNQSIERIAIAVQWCRNKKQGRIKTDGQYYLTGV